MNSLACPSRAQRGPARPPFSSSRSATRQMASYAAIGVVCTAAYVGLYAALRNVSSAAVANVLALVITATATPPPTADSRSRSADATIWSAIKPQRCWPLPWLWPSLRDRWAFSTSSRRTAPPDGDAVLVAANAAATLVRFLLLRLVIGRARSDRSPAEWARHSLLSPRRKGPEDDRRRQARLGPRLRPIEALRGLVRGSCDEAVWVRPAFLGVLALVAVLYLWNLTVSGYANTYYSAARFRRPRAGLPGSSAASTPRTSSPSTSRPLSTMVMGLSVRIFGLSS